MNRGGGRIQGQPGIRRLAGLVALLFCLPALTTGCDRSSAADEAPTGAASRAGRTDRVTLGTFQARLLLTGELEAVESAKIIVPRTPSWRMPVRWMEEDGALVVEGQKVVELDNSTFSGDLEQNRLEESRALNELMRKEADIAVDLSDKSFRMEQARVVHEKARIESDVPEQLRPRREHQEKQLALAKAEVELAKAAEELRSSREAADAELEELGLALAKTRQDVRIAEKAIEDLTLRAPTDGILVISENRREGRKFQTGDNVHVGLAVASIPELTSMQVQARLSDVDDGKIAVGMRALCYLDTYPDDAFPGEVIEIMPIAKEQGRDSRRRAFIVTVRLAETDPERMRPGMSVRAEVMPRPREEVLLVPRTALDFGGEAPQAILADGSAVEVRLGPCNAGVCVVEEGLAEGQKVRTRG